MATFQMTKTGGRWMITSEHRAASAPANGSTQVGPTTARVTAVGACLDKAGVAVSNAGLDGSDGTAHQVLSVELGGLTVAELDVFYSADAAASAYPGIKSNAAPAMAKLVGDAVLDYLRPVPARRMHAIEACA
jgi:hypothetical protein